MHLVLSEIAILIVILNTQHKIPPGCSYAGWLVEVHVYMHFYDLKGQKYFYFFSKCTNTYDTVSDHLESLSTSVIKILTAGRLNDQCVGLYG